MRDGADRLEVQVKDAEIVDALIRALRDCQARLDSAELRAEHWRQVAKEYLDQLTSCEEDEDDGDE